MITHPAHAGGPEMVTLNQLLGALFAQSLIFAFFAGKIYQKLIQMNGEVLRTRKWIHWANDTLNVVTNKLGLHLRDLPQKPQ